MATFIAHGLIGAASVAVPARLLRAPAWLTRILAGLGFILGSAPDTFDWIAAAVFHAQRWVLYGQFHDGIYTKLCAFVYPCGLHLLADTPFHSKPNYDWWADLWWLEVGMLLLGGGAVLWACTRRKPRI